MLASQLHLAWLYHAEKVGRKITMEVQSRCLNREQMKMEARAAGQLEKCIICLAPDCLSSDNITVNSTRKLHDVE